MSAVDLYQARIPFQRDGVRCDHTMITRIQAGLHLGGCRAAGLLPVPAHIDHIVRLTTTDFYDLDSAPQLLSNTVLDVLDTTTQDLSALWPVAEHIATTIPESEDVLIHCQMGINRSAALMARVLMLRNSCTADEAVALLRARRSPFVLFNEHFVEQLRALC